MAERIIKILTDEERGPSMGARGKSIVAEKFASEKHLRNTLELYDEVLGNQTSATEPGRIEWQLNQ
jgi:glycosyltransferase involved in cell wall biosynthesis